MATTAMADKTTVTGVLAESGDGRIVLSLPGTDYRLHLLVDESPRAAVGDRVTGRIHANAMRVDVIRSGGRYIEPVYGRPRRLQGRIVARDANINTITVMTCCAVVCKLMSRQSAGRFEIGQLVSFDVESGARFEWLGDA